MNGRERIACAMRLEMADRVPVMCQLALGHYFLNTDLPPHRIWFTSEGFAEALVTLQRRYSFDGILVNLPGRPEHLLDNAKIEQTRDGEMITWPDGDACLVPWDDNAQYYPGGSQAPRHADFATFNPDRIETADVYPGYHWGVYHTPRLQGTSLPGPLHEPPDYFLRTLDLIRAEVADSVSVHGEVFPPFTHYLELFGYQQALMGLVSDPRRAHAILDRLTAAVIAWVLPQVQHGADAMLISSAFVGGSFISRAMYREFVMPYEKRLTDAIRSAGVPAYTHTCGKIGDRLDLMAETGTQGLDTMDPPPLGNVDLARAKQEVGQQLFLKGNMNPVALLGYTTEREVVAEATRCLEAAMAGGGYILSTACAVAPHMEPWKLKLLAPLAAQIGRYPARCPREEVV